MRTLVLMVILQQSVAVPVTNGDWIGTLAFHDSRGDYVSPVTATLTIADGKAVTGRWHSVRTTSGGTIEGTFMDGRFRVKITLYGGATVTTAAGATEKVAEERCAAETEFIGDLLPTGVIRLTAKRVIFDDPIKRARNKNCEDLTDVMWLLQPHVH